MMVRLQPANECDHKSCKGRVGVPKGSYGGMICLCDCHPKVTRPAPSSCSHCAVALEKHQVASWKNGCHCQCHTPCSSLPEWAYECEDCSITGHPTKLEKALTIALKALEYYAKSEDGMEVVADDAIIAITALGNGKDF